MKTGLYLEIAIRIVVVCLIGMALTFIPPYLRDFFGDTTVEIIKTDYGYTHGDGIVDVSWKWGARHYWYAWAVVLLLLLSVVDSIMHISNSIDKYYPKQESYFIP